MAKAVKKVMILGLDAPITATVYRHAMAGRLPTLKRLIDQGVYAENCLVPYPTITSSNNKSFNEETRTPKHTTRTDYRELTVDQKCTH